MNIKRLHTLFSWALLIGISLSTALGQSADWEGPLNPTNGVKPFRSSGKRITDKNWFRIVESGDYKAGVLSVRFAADATAADRQQAHAAAGNLKSSGDYRV